MSNVAVLSGPYEAALNGEETIQTSGNDCIRKNTLSLERPRKYPKGCPNTT